MSEENESLVQQECESYISNVKTWIGRVESNPVIESRKGVLTRFVRDCNTFIEDVESNDTPSSADQVDFKDRYDSIEVTFTNLFSDS